MGFLLVSMDPRPIAKLDQFKKMLTKINQDNRHTPDEISHEVISQEAIRLKVLVKLTMRIHTGGFVEFFR